MRVNEAVIGVLLIALGVAVFILTASFPRIPGQPYGPDLFPRIIGALLGLAGTMMIVRGVAMTPRRPLVEFPEWARNPRSAGAIVLALAMVVAYIFVSDTLGFVISAAVMLAVLMLYLDVRPHVALLASVATTLMVEYGFGSLMRIPLPRGLLVVFA